MMITVDSNQFPIIEIPEVGLSVGAIPFTKHQYESLWLRKGSDPHTPFNDRCYESWLALNPRSKPGIGVKGNSVADPSRTIWLTGLDPRQAQQILSELGSFNFPLRELWIDVKRLLEARHFNKDEARHWLNLPLCPEARQALSAAWREIRPQNWAQATLMKDGVLEWVISPPSPRRHQETDFVAIGSPPQTALVPEMGDYSRYHEGDRLTESHGFRVWRRL